MEYLNQYSVQIECRSDFKSLVSYTYVWFVSIQFIIIQLCILKLNQTPSVSGKNVR